MKLYGGKSNKDKIKELKQMKNNIIFSLVLITLANAGSIYASIDNKSEGEGIEQLPQTSYHATYGKRIIKYSDLGNKVYYASLSKLNTSLNAKIDSIYPFNNEEEEEEEVTKENDEIVAINREDYYLLNLLGSFPTNLENKSERELDINKLMEIKKSLRSNEITIDNMSNFTLEEIMNYICEKYNLELYQLKTIASTIYYETWSNNYDDVYRVANTIFNRTKSKNWVNDITSRKLKDIEGNVLDGSSMYAQVIAPSQFSGCLCKDGSDFDKLLNKVEYDGSKPFETTLAGLFDFLLSENSIHPFLSFKSKDWVKNNLSESEKSKPGYGITNWVCYSDNGNVYHNPLTESDLLDPDYEIASSQEQSQTLTRRMN